MQLMYQRVRQIIIKLAETVVLAEVVFRQH
jgi:hypothetical protein